MVGCNMDKDVRIFQQIRRPRTDLVFAALHERQSDEIILKGVNHNDAP